MLDPRMFIEAIDEIDELKIKTRDRVEPLPAPGGGELGSGGMNLDYPIPPKQSKIRVLQ